MTTTRLWTDEETKLMVKKMRTGLSFAEIAKDVGRTPSSVKERWRWINRTEEDKEKRRRLTNARRHTARNGVVNPQAMRNSAKRFIPAEVLQERAERLAAPRSLSAVLLGDPPLIQSALLKRDDQTHFSYREAQLRRARPTLAKVEL